MFGEGRITIKTNYVSVKNFIDFPLTENCLELLPSIWRSPQNYRSKENVEESVPFKNVHTPIEELKSVSLERE
jgi:hypothetical protein